jgi:hypothetical protein
MPLATNEPKSIWWKEPMVWLVLGLPATAVVAAVSTYFIAAQGQDSLVTMEFHDEGMYMERITQREDKAAALGINAQLAVSGDRLQLSLAGRMDRAPDDLQLTLEHPARAEKDFQVHLTQVNPRTYIAPMPAMGSGKRYLILEPPDKAWRITGQWQVPFAGKTTLTAAVTSNPSTHP